MLVYPQKESSILYKALWQVVFTSLSLQNVSLYALEIYDIKNLNSLVASGVQQTFGTSNNILLNVWWIYLMNKLQLVVIYCCSTSLRPSV